MRVLERYIIDRNFWATASVAALLSFSSAKAQQDGGSALGIPNNSPGILWPRGQNIESYSSLYPNGPLFGLSNTSGGFGMIGSGPLSGVGLAQNTVSSLVRQEMDRPNALIQRLSGAEALEASRSRSLLETILGRPFLGSSVRPLTAATNRLESPDGSYALPSADSILKDGPATVDSILSR